MYAVFLDYDYDGTSNTVILGGSIATEKADACIFLNSMSCGDLWDETTSIWEVDVDDLPTGYKFQTYYVASYEPGQLMLGVK